MSTLAPRLKVCFTERKKKKIRTSRMYRKIKRRRGGPEVKKAQEEKKGV